MYVPDTWGDVWWYPQDQWTPTDQLWGQQYNVTNTVKAELRVQSSNAHFLHAWKTHPEFPELFTALQDGDRKSQKYTWEDS